MDVTERRQAEENLRRANEAKDEFLGMISHELRTPITTVYGGARLLRSRVGEINEQARAELLRDIEHEADRLRRIVEDLLVLSRLELDAQVPTEPVLLQRLLDKATEACHRRQRDVSLEIESGLPPVAADPTYLEQVLRNILSNAEKYTPDGAPIDIHAGRYEKAEAIVRIIDHGPGVDEEELPHLFDRFYRAERSSKSATGAGIGLTVCKRLIEAQGGRVWATTQEGNGLEIAFTLPLYEEVSA
jgi:signal transduction histidine kinase